MLDGAVVAPGHVGRDLLEVLVLKRHSDEREDYGVSKRPDPGSDGDSLDELMLSSLTTSAPFALRSSTTFCLSSAEAFFLNLMMAGGQLISTDDLTLFTVRHSAVCSISSGYSRYVTYNVR